MMLLTHVIAAGAVALAGAGAAGRAPAGGTPNVIVVAPRAAQDSAELLYRAGRDAINRGDFRRAADVFERIGERYPRSAQASDALYWRAFALYRIGGTSDLRRARTSLRTLRESGRDAYRADASALDTRICGELARRGDAQCAATVEDRADSSTLAAAVGEVARAGMAMAAGAMRAASEATASALRDPDTQAALAQAGAAAQRAASDAGHVVGEAARDAAREADRAMRDAAMRDASRDMSRRSRSRSSTECEESDDDEQVIALNALLQMDAERAMPLLKKVMAKRGQCAEVLRRKAVFLVARKNTPEAADMLIDAARNDPDAEVREQAVFWLSRVNADKAQSFLRELALQPGGDVEVRKNALFSLSQMSGGRETLRQVASAETDAEVREQAIFWLGQRGTPEDVDFLKSLYGKLQNRDLKDKVLFAVSRRKGNASWLLDVAVDPKESVDLRKQALFWAGQGGAPIEQLVSLYDKTADKEMKKQLVFVYQQRGSGPAFEKLLDIARTEKDREIRNDALFWLSRSKDPRAVKLFEDIINK